MARGDKGYEKVKAATAKADRKRIGRQDKEVAAANEKKKEVIEEEERENPDELQ